MIACVLQIKVFPGSDTKYTVTVNRCNSSVAFLEPASAYVRTEKKIPIAANQC